MNTVIYRFSHACLFSYIFVKTRIYCTRLSGNLLEVPDSFEARTMESCPRTLSNSFWWRRTATFVAGRPWAQHNTLCFQKESVIFIWQEIFECRILWYASQPIIFEHLLGLIYWTLLRSCC